MALLSLFAVVVPIAVAPVAAVVVIIINIVGNVAVVVVVVIVVVVCSNVVVVVVVVCNVVVVVVVVVVVCNVVVYIILLLLLLLFMLLFCFSCWWYYCCLLLPLLLLLLLLLLQWLSWGADVRTRVVLAVIGCLYSFFLCPVMSFPLFSTGVHLSFPGIFVSKFGLSICLYACLLVCHRALLFVRLFCKKIQSRYHYHCRRCLCCHCELS